MDYQYIIENYIIFKNSLVSETIFKNEKKGKLNFFCDCGKEINLNGVTSHKKICKCANSSKIKFLKNRFKISDKCVVCNSNINIPNYDIKYLRSSHIHFCSVECYYKALKVVLRYEKYLSNCEVCGKHFLKSVKKIKTCSPECASKLLIVGRFNYWNSPEYEESRINRSKKLSNIVLNYIKNNPNRKPVWKLNIKGAEYLKHYDKSDGSNSLLDGIAKNKKLFRKTSLEIKFESILIDFKLDFKYGEFLFGKQYDFIVHFKNAILVVETDGDYFHKSSKRCNNKEEIQIQRLSDKLKDKLIEIDANEKTHTKRKWYIIRFWEYTINNNIDVTKLYLKNLIEEDINGNKEKFESIIQEIKEYYIKES